MTAQGSGAAARSHIESSWRRAALYGVDPRTPRNLQVRDVDPSSRLLQLAGPLVDDLHTQLADHPLCLMLADSDCRVIRLWGRDRGLRNKLETSGVAVGIQLDESSAGTNGLGTPFETGRGASINGSEHYLESLKGFSCVGWPIRHPLTRRIEGILDVTVEGAMANPLFAPLLKRTVEDIEHALADAARETERRVFRAFQNASRRRSDPVAALGGELVLANRCCLERLVPAGPGILRLLLDDVPPAGRVTLDLDLDLGPRGRLLVEAERIEGTRDGALFFLGARSAGTGAPVQPARSTDAPKTMLVAGEPGTGRTTMAQREAAGGSCITLDAVDGVCRPERDWAAKLVESAASSVDVLVIENVHVLSESLSEVLRRVMASPASPRIVLTSCPVDQLPHPGVNLAGACARRVALRPLRERLHELPALVAELSQQRLSGRTLTISAPALECLTAHPWPGNLGQLARLVDMLGSRPRLGSVTVADLPAEYRTSPRVGKLGGREQAERIAIINALRLCCGNKARAAEQLGISRTTLYRRMQALVVTDAVAVDVERLGPA